MFLWRQSLHLTSLTSIYYQNFLNKPSLADCWYFAALALFRFLLPSSSASSAGAVDAGGVEASFSSGNRQKTGPGRDRRASGDLMGKSTCLGLGGVSVASICPSFSLSGVTVALSRLAIRRI